VKPSHDGCGLTVNSIFLPQRLFKFGCDFLLRQEQDFDCHVGLGFDVAPLAFKSSNTSLPRRNLRQAFNEELDILFGCRGRISVPGGAFCHPQLVKPSFDCISVTNTF
jgi:hypothetical protein